MCLIKQYPLHISSMLCYKNHCNIFSIILYHKHFQSLLIFSGLFPSSCSLVKCSSCPRAPWICSCVPAPPCTPGNYSPWSRGLVPPASGQKKQRFDEQCLREPVCGKEVERVYNSFRIDCAQSVSIRVWYPCSSLSRSWLSCTQIG